ncbi:MAG: DUF6576 domain-containing protein, partial [Gemmatimonadota bacterium]
VYIWGIFPIKAKWFVALLGGAAFVSTFFGGGRGVADWAHLGGLVTGFLYLRWGDRAERTLRAAWKKLPRRVRHPFGGRRTGRSTDIRVEDGGALSSGGGDRRSGGSGGPTGRRTPGEEGDDLDRVNEILDKIREEGMEALTAEEREFLDEVSRRYRD